MQTLGPYYVNFSDLPNDLDQYVIPAPVDGNLILTLFALLLTQWDNPNSDSSLNVALTTAGGQLIAAPTWPNIDSSAQIYSPANPFTFRDFGQLFPNTTLPLTAVTLTYHQGTAPAPPTQGRMAFYFLVQPFTQPT